MIRGRKRHILTDTIGLPVTMIVHPADVQIATVRPLCWSAHAVSPGCATCLPMVATPGTS